ncbi:MAG TPA: rod shape-determining protein MreC [Rhabdochlamydiaceae bacterium]|nr:rod shape-determining protein MreC [Rhabdochlamydiaceae bacterium]
MRNKIAYRPYLLLLALLFFTLSFPTSTTEKLRSGIVAMFSPSWRGMHFLKGGFFNLLTITTPTTSTISTDKSLELDRLHQENQILKSQIESVREWLLFEDRISEQLNRLKSISSEETSDSYWVEFFKRRNDELYQSLNLQLQSMPAKVIFREPGSWSSSVWLNVGERHNEALGRKVIGKNSPVLVGGSIVGVVEYVSKSQCRVRLITDSGLIPSVRAVRGAEQNRFVLDNLEALISGLELREDLFSSQELRIDFLTKLKSLKNHLLQMTGDSYLAKGELYGSGSSLWRSRSQVLRGTGFNYDFSDEEGPARDPRSGESMDSLTKLEPIPILKEGDLLVTTGMDGVFPPGFHVAVVTKIGRLREGGASYELEAKACAGNLEELKHVFVLPPLEFDKGFTNR